MRELRWILPGFLGHGSCSQNSINEGMEKCSQQLCAEDGELEKIKYLQIDRQWGAGPSISC
jgi:hypothetical protein